MRKLRDRLVCKRTKRQTGKILSARLDADLVYIYILYDFINVFFFLPFTYLGKKVDLYKAKITKL